MILIYKAKEKYNKNITNSTINTWIAVIDKTSNSWNGPYQRFDTYFDDARW